MLLIITTFLLFSQVYSCLADDKDYPYVVTLYKNDRPVCGGEIIHEQYILTGACPGLIEASNPLKDFSVGWGSTFLHNQNKTKAIASYKLFESTIRLIKLENPLSLNSKVEKINIPKNGPLSSQSVLILYWDDLTYYKETANFTVVETQVHNSWPFTIEVVANTSRKCTEDFGNLLVGMDGTGNPLAYGMFSGEPCLSGIVVYDSLNAYKKLIEIIINATSTTI